MKRIITLFHHLLPCSGKGVLAMLLFACICSTASGQTGAGKDLGDFSAITWKATADLNAALSDEQARANLALTAPGMPLEEKALFLSYKRMLSYIQADLQAGKPADEAIVSSYEQVLNEAPKDVDLAYLPDGLLATFVPGLVESLAASPKPGN